MKQDTGQEVLRSMKLKRSTDVGYNFALCALLFFRGRHGTKPRFKGSKRNQDIPAYMGHVRRARYFMLNAGKAGFGGSVPQRVLKVAGL